MVQHRNHRYAIYFNQSRWACDRDSFCVENREERDQNLKELMKHKEDYTEIAYCPIYKNGEYGALVKVFDRRSFARSQTEEDVIRQAEEDVIQQAEEDTIRQAEEDVVRQIAEDGMER